MKKRNYAKEIKKAVKDFEAGKITREELRAAADAAYTAYDAAYTAYAAAYDAAWAAADAVAAWAAADAVAADALAKKDNN